jgi:hypothetical protein
MLEQLQNQTIGEHRIHVVTIEPAHYFDQHDFALYLIDSCGVMSETPVFHGRFNAGRPSIYVPAWIDGEFVEYPSDNAGWMAGVSVIGLPSPVITGIAERLGTLIPPGGRLWFAYEAFDGEGDLMRETRAALSARVPIIATPIGYLLFCAGCWVGLRDWDIPEGGREGPRKLQGNKPLNAAHAQRRAREIISVLEEFMTRAQTGIEQRARGRAQVMLPALRIVAAAT